MSRYHFFRGVLPGQGIVIAPDGSASVIDKENMQSTVDPYSWTIDYVLYGRAVTGQDVLALCERIEQMLALLDRAEILIIADNGDFNGWLEDYAAWKNRSG